jgi:hypothetical protein
MYFIIQQRSREPFNLLNLLRFNCNNFVALANTKLRISEDDVDGLKHVAEFTVYRILLTYMLCICWSG